MNYLMFSINIIKRDLQSGWPLTRLPSKRDFFWIFLYYQFFIIEKYEPMLWGVPPKKGTNLSLSEEMSVQKIFSHPYSDITAQPYKPNNPAPWKRIQWNVSLGILIIHMHRCIYIVYTNIYIHITLPMGPLIFSVVYPTVYPQFYRKCEYIKFKFRLCPLKVFWRQLYPQKPAKPGCRKASSS